MAMNRNPLRSALRRLRRFVRHRDEFVVCGAAVEEHRVLEALSDLFCEAMPPERFEELTSVSPHITRHDVDDFRRRQTSAVVMRDGGRVVAVNFFVRGPGSVWVEEFAHEVPLCDGDHYSCRTYVDPGYRGRALYDQMIAFYLRDLHATDRIWGLVMTRNEPSLRMLHRVGWTDWGRWIATTKFGRVSTKRIDHEPRPLHQMG